MELSSGHTSDSFLKCFFSVFSATPWLNPVRKLRAKGAIAVAEAHEPLSIGQCATLACILEVTAPKPGNVHRGADFDDVTYLDFVTGAAAIGPVMEAAATGQRLGPTVLAAVQATRQVVNTNTNLGTILLLAPLAMVDRKLDWAAGIAHVLSFLDANDAKLVYEAIRLAQPSGLGEAPEADVRGTAPTDLIHAMRLSAERDLVAKQYAGGFVEVLRNVVPCLADGVAAGWPLADAIVHAQMRMMSEFPDSLIARKRGTAVAEKSAQWANRVLEAGRPGDEAYHRALADFDFWLRSDGRGRNPGTTADMIAASLFVALRDGIIEAPWSFYRQTREGRPEA